MIELAAWQDAELPFTVEYASPAFERIRQRAAEGLIALPRVGMGVGGLLLGERTPAGIRIAGTVELPCSHTLGPTFQLTSDEIRQSLELVKSAGAQRPVVGIYRTRTRGARWPWALPIASCLTPSVLSLGKSPWLCGPRPVSRPRPPSSSARRANWRRAPCGNFGSGGRRNWRIRTGDSPPPLPESEPRRLHKPARRL